MAGAASVSVIITANYVGDRFLVEYGIGSPAPNETIYLYVNGSQVNAVSNQSNWYYWYTPPSAGTYTFDVYYSDSINGPFSPTWNSTAGSYSVANPPPPPVGGGSTNGIVGAPFSYQINGGSYVSSYGANGLPSGLGVNTNSGVISGVPTSTGTWSANIYAYNMTGSGSASLNITINPAIPPAITVQPINESPASIRAVASTNSRTVAVRQDGEAWSWGSNQYGQLGDGTTTNRSTPSPIIGVTGVINVAAGQYHTLMVTSSGSVFADGVNTYGQLGDGTTTERHLPVPVVGLANVTSTSAGNNHSVAVKADGTVWTWGDNSMYQLGDGTAIQRNTPVQVPGLSGMIAVAACGDYTLALKSDGTVWAWGYNWYGQLGDGTTVTRGAPVKVVGLANVVQIAAGQNHSLAMKSDGTVWAWGKNGSGQLGDGSTVNRVTPVQVAITNVVSISAGYSHSVAVRADGTVWTWGTNGYGQLGDGTTIDRASPVQMSNVTGVVMASGGQLQTAVVKNDGTVWESGLPETGIVSRIPTQTPGLQDTVFDVMASGTPAPTFQWQRKPAGQTTFVNLSDGMSYTGTQTAALRVVGPTATMSGDQFRCTVSNSGGSATSNIVTLTVGPPTLSVVGGNNQVALGGQFNAKPFDVAVWNSGGTAPCVGMPVTYTVRSGGGFLASTNSGSPVLVTSLTLNSDVDGTAQAYYKQPSGVSVTSQITAAVPGNQVTLLTSNTNATTPGDSDGNGLNDAWETRYFGHTGVDPTADADGDGLTNLQEYLLGTNPVDAADGKMPSSGGYQILLATPASGYLGVKSDWSITPVSTT